MSRRRRPASGRPQHPKGLPSAAMSTKAAQHPVVRVPTIASVPSVDTLRSVLSASAGIEEAYDDLSAAVARARDDGHTWSVIGQALGVSAQTAHKRFARSHQ
jgi:hypothetical protein